MSEEPYIFMVIVVVCRHRRKKKYLLTVNETRKLPSYRTLTFEMEEEHLEDQKEEGENNTHEAEASQKLTHVLLLGKENRQSWV